MAANLVSGIESFNENAIWAKVSGGFKDGGTKLRGPFNVQSYRIVDGDKMSIDNKFNRRMPETMPVVTRRVG